MSSELDVLIDVGRDITSLKYYGVAVCTILFYDYFLTLADEIKYAWSGNKSWTFWLFIADRYFPMTYQFWVLTASYSWHPNTKVCDKTAFYSILTFVICTLLAQVVLTVRVYAVAKKNVPILIGFAVITISQLALGICLVVLAAREGAQTLPPIPFDAYRLCVFVRHRTLEVAYTSVSLLYDSLAFFLIIFLAKKSNADGSKVTGILGTIVEDATRYFLVIFTSHFVLVMTLNLGRDTIQLLPASGNVVYLPVMISRIMLSLKRAADSRQKKWSLSGISAGSTAFRSIKFRDQKGKNRMDDTSVVLDTLPEPQTATQLAWIGRQ